MPGKQKQRKTKSKRNQNETQQQSKAAQASRHTGLGHRRVASLWFSWLGHRFGACCSESKLWGKLTKE